MQPDKKLHSPKTLKKFSIEKQLNNKGKIKISIPNLNYKKKIKKYNKPKPIKITYYNHGALGYTHIGGGTPGQWLLFPLNRVRLIFFAFKCF